MKTMNLVKSGIMSVVGTIVISASIANAGEGYNLLFDANQQNGGQPLNYKNSGCLIYNASENMGRSSMASYAYGAGVFYASGDERACAKVCSQWQVSFTKTPGPYYWDSNYMYVYPKGFPVGYYVPGVDYTSHFVCKTNYSSYSGGREYCFQPSLAPEPNPKKTPYVFLTHNSDYAYCSLKGALYF